MEPIKRDLLMILLAFVCSTGAYAQDELVFNSSIVNSVTFNKKDSVLTIRYSLKDHSSKMIWVGDFLIEAITNVSDLSPASLTSPITHEIYLTSRATGDKHSTDFFLRGDTLKEGDLRNYQIISLTDTVSISFDIKDSKLYSAILKGALEIKGVVTVINNANMSLHIQRGNKAGSKPTFIDLYESDAENMPIFLRKKDWVFNRPVVAQNMNGHIGGTMAMGNLSDKSFIYPKKIENLPPVTVPRALVHLFSTKVFFSSKIKVK
ncbi:MAG: hypothetical protein EOP48_07620 [Sphingobacteriales bacterium]|nr:MAG: hypothetical protein EOP48_07620 [Sphingobacteriales bacterium]